MRTAGAERDIKGFVEELHRELLAADLTHTHGCSRLVELFNKLSNIMATVNFSVPEEIKAAFNRAFAKRNKSAIIANLMAKAVEEEKTRKKQSKAIDRLLVRRATKNPISDEEFRAAREELRK